MNKLKSPLFLWIILGAIILLLSRCSHLRPRGTFTGGGRTQATTAVSSKVSSATTTTEQPKVGWRIGDEAPDFELTTIG